MEKKDLQISTSHPPPYIPPSDRPDKETRSLEYFRQCVRKRLINLWAVTPLIQHLKEKKRSTQKDGVDTIKLGAARSATSDLLVQKETETAPDVLHPGQLLEHQESETEKERREVFSKLSSDVKYDELTLENEIGRGQFGAVSRATYHGVTVAVKKVFQSGGKGTKDEQKYLKREVKAMRELEHPNIVRLIGLCLKDTNVFLVLEYVAGGNLLQFLKSQEVEIPWLLRLAAAYDLANALKCLHSKGFIHRDIKSENVLVDQNGGLKLIDFGFTRKLQQKNIAANKGLTMCGTDAYMSPEMILGMEYDYGTDIFSYGIVGLEIITREQATERSPRNCFEVDAELITPLIPSECPEKFHQLMFECCAYEASARPTTEQILERLVEIRQNLV